MLFPTPEWPTNAYFGNSDTKKPVFEFVNFGVKSLNKSISSRFDSPLLYILS